MNTLLTCPPDIVPRSRLRSRAAGYETIAYSEEGRPLQVCRLGAASASLRVLILAGQHGDESIAMEAVRTFATRFDPTDHSRVGVAVLVCANPDGTAQNSRTNANGLDLNRDHLLLHSAEVQAIHAFVRVWQPHLILDVHTYPARRKHLLRHGLAYCHDVFLDIPTNPSLRLPLDEAARRRFLSTMQHRMAQCGFRCDRYTLISRRGRVRHSTPDVVDARNALALRYGVFTVLIEGRQPRRREPVAARQRTHDALLAALREIVRWADRHRASLTASPAIPAPGTSVAIRARYAAAPMPRRMAFADTETGTVRAVTLPGRYTPTLTVTERVTLPQAYAIPNACTDVLAVLQRHRFGHRCGRGRHRVEQFITEAVTPSKQPRRVPRRLSGFWTMQQRLLPGYQVFPTCQPGGHALAALLEPHAKYALHRFANVSLPLIPTIPYPILRVY